jgi:hypothetical protein
MTAGHEVPYIEPVKLLGTTWYRRGPAYWARRVGLSLVYLLLAVGGGALSVLLLRAFWVDPTAPIAVRIGATVVGVVATVWMAVTTVRAYQRAERTTVRPRRRVLTGVLGYAKVFGFLVVVVVFCVFILLGGMGATFGYSLRREFFGEHQARLRQGHGRHR